MNEIPRHLLLTDAAGLPRGVIDLPQVQAAAVVLMYELSCAAGDDAALDRIGDEWAETLSPDEHGLTAAAALMLTMRCVLAPILEVLATLSPELSRDLRAKLCESRDYAQATLGGGQ